MRRALITGASSGIGLELARVMAADGWRLVLSGRNAAALTALAGELGGAETAEIVVMDLAQPGAAAALAERAGEIDALVNNAGLGALGRFAAGNWARPAEILQVNVVAATELTHRLLPGMLARRRGHILNVASVAGFLPGPFMAVYYASKAYLLSWSEALAEELRGTGVTATALCPGPTTTDFGRRAGFQTFGFSFGGTDLVSMSGRAVAEIGYRAMLDGRPVAVSGWTNKAITRAVGWVPRRLLLRLVRRAQEGR